MAVTSNSNSAKEKQWNSIFKVFKENNCQFRNLLAEENISKFRVK